MTHTLHREGSEESLKNDYILLITPAMGFNDQGAAEKIKKLVDIVFEAGPINYGAYELGKNILSGVNAEMIKETTRNNSRIRCVFTSKEKIKYIIRRVIEEDLGLSVTLSGLRFDIEEILKEMNIDPHSINIAMGTYGNVARLPDPNFRTITTMCGHGMVSPDTVKDMLIKIKKGRISFEEAGIELSKPCVCGVFNQERAARLLRKYCKLYSLN